MATVKIDGSRMGAVFRAMAKRHPAAVRAGLRDGAERGRTAMKRLTPVDLALMINAWEVHNQPYGASLDNTAPYAGIIEGGARPHGVSAEGRLAIRDWVMRNLEVGAVKRGKNAGRARKLSSRERTAIKDNDPAAEYAKAVDSVVFAICEKIRRKGTTGKFMVRNNLDKLGRWANQAVKAAIERELNNPPR
jgi:hypothetical protein